MEALAAKKAEIEGMVDKMKAKQGEARKAGVGLQGLQSQLSENVMVKAELDRLADGAKVYKLVGPVLLPQDLDEARSVVDTRIGFIKTSVGKGEAKVAALQKEAQEAQVVILGKQQEFQRSVQEAAKTNPALMQAAAAGGARR